MREKKWVKGIPACLRRSQHAFYDTIIGSICHTFVNGRTHNTKSEQECKPWALGDNCHSEVPVGPWLVEMHHVQLRRLLEEVEHVCERGIRVLSSSVLSSPFAGDHIHIYISSGELRDGGLGTSTHGQSVVIMEA